VVAVSSVDVEAHAAVGPEQRRHEIDRVVFRAQLDLQRERSTTRLRDLDAGDGTVGARFVLVDESGARLLPERPASDRIGSLRQRERLLRGGRTVDEERDRTASEGRIADDEIGATRLLCLTGGLAFGRVGSGLRILDD